MEIIIILVLILLNGLFSMSEIALVSSRKFKLENAAKNGNPKARKALDLSNSPNTFLATVQIGITLIGILTGVFSGDKITGALEAKLLQVSFLHDYAHVLAVVLVVIIVTYLSIVLGELLPKRIGLHFPERIALAVARPMGILSRAAAPFIWLLTRTNDLLLRMLGIREGRTSAVTEEEIKAMIESGAEGGDILQIEQDIVQRVFALGDLRISELMTHRSDVTWLEINDDLATVKRKVAAGVHSVYPVARGTLDNLAGVLNLKELFPLELKSDTFKIETYLRKPLVVHDNAPVYKVMESFRENPHTTAVVVDEYGDVQGIISLNDVLRALVGNAQGSGETDQLIVARNDHEWFVDGQTPYFELLDYFDVAADDEEEGDFNTVAGLFLHLHGKIPAVGDKVRWKGFLFEVVDMDGMRIDKMLVTRKDAAE